MAGEERVLALEGELQNLKLELESQQRANAQLRLELERQRGGESARLAAVQVEQLLGDAATPVSQVANPNPSFEGGGKAGAGP